MSRPLVALVLASLLPLAGCLGGADEDAAGTRSDGTALAADDAALAPDDDSTVATSPADMTGGHAPHIHNYWGESDRVTLYDDVVSIQADDLNPTLINAIILKQAALGGTFWELPDGATVYEGTGVVEMTVTWTDPTITGLALYYKSADKQFEVEGFTGPLPLAKDTLTKIDVTPQMTDMPHEAVSRWAFYFAPAGAPAVAEGSFHLKLDIVRMRDVMEFPGHPDNYEEVSHYVLADREFTYRSQSFLTEVANLVTTSQGREAIVPDEIVPMETHAMLVQIDVSQSSATAPVLQREGMRMLYVAADGRQVYEAKLLNRTETSFVFGIPVTDSQVDSPYAEDSSWRLYVFVQQKADLPVETRSCGGCFDAEIAGHVKIVAWETDPTGLIGEPQPFRRGR